MSPSRRLFLGASATGAAAAVVPASLLAEEKKPAEEPIDISSLGKTKNTKFAVNVEMWWSKLPFMERLVKAAEFGFPAVEIWPYQNKDVPAVAKLCKEKKIDIAQFSAWGFEPGMNNPANEEKCVKQIEEACGIAHQWSCNKMCVVAGNNQKGMTKEEMHAQVTKVLKRVAPIAEREKVMLILEPMNGRVDHPGHCLYGTEDAVKICRAVSSPMVKVLFDLYHAQIAEGDLCGHLKDGVDQLGYVQIADHPGRNEPGTGEIYYPRVMRQLKDLGYTGYVGLELVPKDGNSLAAALAVKQMDAAW
ncbi:MAG TPA: TIM barrel protein [Pirellulaceae bacterium]|nr:TIM barrel protein [Pirellulaceae bacterium]